MHTLSLRFCYIKMSHCSSSFKVTLYQYTKSGVFRRLVSRLNCSFLQVSNVRFATSVANASYVGIFESLQYIGVVTNAAYGGDAGSSEIPSPTFLYRVRFTCPFVYPVLFPLCCFFMLFPRVVSPYCIPVLFLLCCFSCFIMSIYLWVVWWILACLFIVINNAY